MSKLQQEINLLNIELEFAYRVQERLGILCGTDDPTVEQLELATREADEACEKLKKSV